MVQQIQITIEFGDDPILLTDLASELQEVVKVKEGEIISCFKIVKSKKRIKEAN